MPKVKARYVVALSCLLSLLLAGIDLYIFAYILLPLWIFIESLGCSLVLYVKKFRRFVRVGVACYGCSLVVLILGGVVGNELNKRNQADAVSVVNRIEKFRLETGHYPRSDVEISSIGIDIPTKRVKFRGRWLYSTKENDGDYYYFRIQTFPIGFVKWNRKTKGFVKWNRKTKVWNDE